MNINLFVPNKAITTDIAWEWAQQQDIITIETLYRDGADIVVEPAFEEQALPGIDEVMEVDLVRWFNRQVSIENVVILSDN